MVTQRKTQIARGLCGLIAVLALAGCPKPADPSFVPVFTASTTIGDAPLSVTFTDISDVDSALITGYLWEFGDGTTSTEASPTHVFNDPGAYTVRFTLLTNIPRGDDTETRRNFIVALNPNREEGAVAGEVRTFAEIDFVWVPAGSFEMGQTADTFSDQPEALPVHTVTISRGFWMSAHEVTQIEWERYMSYNPALFSTDSGEKPIEQVTWFEAQDYIDQLNELDEGVFRLPSEAEWEYACRAGSATTYSFGDDPDDLSMYAWSWDSARFETQPVSLLLPNAWGLYDMHGNVREWCQDRYRADYYTVSPATDPRGSDAGIFRVTRGGSWYDLAHSHASSYRTFGLATAQASHVGFRIVRQ